MSLAPAAAKDGFAFAGDFYAEASDHNRHRRATLAELKDLFKSGEDKARPWHWFESQLVHYGLPPSKTKAVARMRLYDAVNGAKLSVPAHIKKLEADLKKEWTKNEREAKKAMKAPATASSSAPAKGTKRKAESSSVDLTLNVGGINVTLSTNSSSSQAGAKKAKTTKTAATKSTTTAASAAKPKTQSKPKETVPKKAAPKKEAPKKEAPKKDTPKKDAPKKDAPKKAAPKKAAPKTTGQKQEGTSSGTSARTKQTARRGGISQGPGRGGSAAKPASPVAPRTGRTARRSGAWAAYGRIHAPSQPVNDYDNGNGNFGYDEPPPPYSEYGGVDYGNDDDDDDDNEEDTGNDYHDHDGDNELRPLGLLNGRYSIVSSDVSDQWDYDEDDFSLILTLSGQELWGKFDLGVITGILRFSVRPWESSNDRVSFTWRGEENEGPMFYGNDNNGWVKFLGDGRIEGRFDFMALDFQGKRFQNQGTRSEVEVSAMRYEWNSYTHDEYERRNQARWH